MELRLASDGDGILDFLSMRGEKRNDFAGNIKGENSVGTRTANIHIGDSHTTI